jgi:hypothetical protein
MIVYLPYCICTVPGRRLAVIAAVYILRQKFMMRSVRLDCQVWGAVRFGPGSENTQLW